MTDATLLEVLSQIPAGVVIAESPSGKVVFRNIEAERMRAPCGEQTPLARTLRTGELASDELQVRARDGSREFLTVSSAPIRDALGHLSGSVAVYTDVTARVAVEEELRTTRERLQGIIDTVDGIVWEVDFQTFDFTFVSRQAERLLGYPIEAWYQSGFWSGILHPDDREYAVAFCLDKTHRLEAHDFEYRVRAQDGRLVWLRDLVSVVAADGCPVTLRGIMVDVTARRQAEEDRTRLLLAEKTARQLAEREQHRSAFLASVSRELGRSLDYTETLSAIVRLVVPFCADWAAIAAIGPDRALRVVAFSEHSPALAASLERVILGRPVMTPELARQRRSLLQADLDPSTSGSDPLWESALGPLAPAQRDALRALGTRSFIAVPLSAHDRDIGVLVLGSTRDRRYDDDELVLAEDVGLRASTALDNAWLYQDAQNAILLRDDFLSIASHELYTPVHSLQLALQGITSSPTPLSPESSARALRLAQRQVQRLIALMTTLLDASRVQSGQLETDPAAVDLVTIAEDVATDLAIDLSRAACTLTIDAPRPVIGSWDRQRLGQAIGNLLANAIKFGRGKPIALTIGERDGLATLSVADHGIGIAAERLPDIFERFERVVSARDYGGFGLGLYIVRAIVEAHGGTVRVASTAGEGTTFTIELPLQRGA